MASNTTSTTSLYENKPTVLNITCTAGNRVVGSTLVNFNGSVSVSQQQGNYNLLSIRATITDDITGQGVANYTIVKPANIYIGTANFSFNINVGSYAGGTRSITARFTVFNSAGTAPVGDIVPLSVNVPYGAGSEYPATPDISAVVDSNNQISITYGTTSFGYPPTGTVRLFGDAGQAPITEIDSKTTTGYTTFIHTGLVPGTQYYYRVSASNGPLTSYSTTISATTDKYGMYGSVSSNSKRITKMYGSVDGSSKRIKLYGSKDGATKRIL